ncbi:hypothetical protein SteCoe_14250 [Stentor coeruleus]|uniref:Uncharacterized protein n=1 Tax=Stentor coeruleus TaxID=5963 RepID=A0A1R2C6H1_9CILI|nr:hypothetical protein SteCoe_14250 [Stentor coeruleus]
MYFQDDRPLSYERPQETANTKLEHLQNLYDERIDSLTKQLEAFFTEISNDEIFKAMQENPLTQEYASQRAGELFAEIMNSEQESTIKRLQIELSEYKSLNLKFESDEQRMVKIIRELEEKLKKAEGDKEKLLNDYEMMINKFSNAEDRLDESLKRKDAEWLHKMDVNMRKMEATLQDTEEKYFITRKELENLTSTRMNTDMLYNECDRLKRELKTQELFYLRQQEESKRVFEGRIIEFNEKIINKDKIYEDLSSQFKNYQKQSEDLSANQQNLIKNLVDKSKQLKQKIISQKSKLSDYMKLSKESTINLENANSTYTRTVTDLENRIKTIEKEAIQKETDLITKQQLQLTQLQQHYKQMMDTKMLEMQKEINEQIIRSQEHDIEVKNIMDKKMKEIERDYLPKSVHDKILTDRENFMMKKFNVRIDEITQNHEEEKEVMRKEIEEVKKDKEQVMENLEVSQKAEENLKRETMREKEKINNNLNEKVKKIKKVKSVNQELSRDLEKTKKEFAELQNHYNTEISSRIQSEKQVINLNNTLNELKETLNQSKQSSQTAKFQHEQTLSQISEKTNLLERELEIKAKTIQRYDDEILMLQSSLRDSKLQQSGYLTQLELEQSRHLDTKKKLKEIEDYSQKLLSEIDFRQNKHNDYYSSIDNYKEQIRNLSIAVEGKDQEIFNIKQNYGNKENDLKQKLRLVTEKCRKYVVNSIFFLRKQLEGVVELYEHEFASMNKNFSQVKQEISIKVLELQLQYRKQLEGKAQEFTDEIKDYYRAKLAQIEDYILQENTQWADQETEGLRRAIKSIIEKKHIGQVEIKSLKDTIANITQQNESLYRENQKLQIRLHANNEAFDQLQKEVTEEANKIKLRLEAGSVKDRMDYSARNYYRK